MTEGRAAGGTPVPRSFGYLILLQVGHLSRRMQSALGEGTARLVTNGPGRSIADSRQICWGNNARAQSPACDACARPFRLLFVVDAFSAGNSFASNYAGLTYD